MRRPVKPFVTEYKAGNRRPKDGTGGFGNEPEALAPEPGARKAKTRSPQPKSVQPNYLSVDHAAEAQPSDAKASSARQAKGQPNRFSSAQGEDSYEAAMRAADALFSGAARPSPPSDDASSTQASPTQASSVNDVFKQAPAEAPSPTGGRILQAIDQPPDTTMADIEAERAPKRRGRKPGSKNKPKVQAAPPATGPAPHPMDDDEDDESVPFGDLPLPSTLRPSLSAPRLPLVHPVFVSRGALRFAWVRTKLGPGEQWKRRLPKVIW